MDKETWRKAHFEEDLPDCLPLPDRREVQEQGWESFSLPWDRETDRVLAAGSLLLLLGVYGGLSEGCCLIREKQGWLPLHQCWQLGDKACAMLAETEKLLSEGGAFAWEKKEAEAALGLATGRGVALSLAGEAAPEEWENLALIFRAGKELEISYQTSLYTGEFIRTLALSWREILRSLPEADTLARVSITAPETLAKLDGFNRTEQPYDKETVLTRQFRARAKEMPENVAVIYEEKSYTYAQVDDLSDRLALHIHRQGLGRGDTVSVFIGRSEYMVIASLGVLKAGCAYEALDPNYPNERLSFMVKDAGAGLVLVEDSLAERLADFEYEGGRLLLSEIATLPRAEAGELEEIEPPRPEDLFTLIYTSGTTGVPKGVRLLQKNIMAYAAWYRRYYEPNAESRITCYNSYGFDGSLTDMYPALTVGAAVVVIPEEKKLDLSAIAELVNRHGVYLADLPSQVGRQFALTMDCPSLKYIVVGGEKLVSFQPVHPYIIANEYGPTETTVSITCYNMTKHEADIPIGRPNDNTAIYVVDGAGRRVPPGALGELWAAGVQVAGGYLNRPEKTAEVFVENPFNDSDDYKTAYRTGDVVRYLPDGNIEFAGRRDGLVKIRGFRVELSEVEGVVCDFPQVETGAVVAWDNPAGGKFIAAYVTGKEEIDREALADFIRQRKPPYMVPAAIVQLPAIPRNQNGKLNRKALPVPEIHGSEAPYAEPEGETEKELARGFGLALGMEKVSAAEDFFEAGGDSLSLVRLLSECRSLQLNFDLIYEGKTPRGIAALLREREAGKTGKKQRETHFFGPLHELHYEWGNSLEEGYGVHCDATVFLDPATDMEHLAGAIEKALLAHPAVDARLTEAGEALRWKPGDMAGVRPEVEKLSRRDYESLKPALRQSLNKPETRMFVTRLFEIEEEDGQVSKEFYFDFLHTIIDGDSINIFLEDIDAAYRGEELQSEEYSIFDYYDEIEDRLSTPAYAKERQWNRDYVASFTKRPGELPGDLDPRGENDTKAIVVPLHIDLGATDAFTRAKGVTDGSLLAAAFGLLQSLNNGEQAAAILTIYNGRDDARYERTMGAVYRHYPLCVRWQENMSGERFVKETQASTLLCRRHALYEGDPVPLIASFAYQGEDVDGQFPFCGGKARYEEIEDFEEENFNFYIHRRSDDFYCCLTYNTKEYSDAFVRRFLEDYARAVCGLAAGRSVGEIVAALKGR